MIYLNKEMINEPLPLPNPSNTPQTITETEDTKKPQLMIRNACCPTRIVFSFVVNNIINSLENVIQINVPIAIIQIANKRETWNI